MRRTGRSGLSKAGRLGTRIWRQSRARAPAAGSAHPHNPDAANEGQSSIASRSTVVSAKGTCLSGQSSGKQERWGLGAAAAAKGTVLLSQLPSPDRYRDQREGRARPRRGGCGAPALVAGNIPLRRRWGARRCRPAGCRAYRMPVRAWARNFRDADPDVNGTTYHRAATTPS